MLSRIHIEANKVPIYVQLREQFLRAIGEGVLRPGEQLPTVRAVATALRVNGNTVQQAYAELERDGAIVTQRGRGTFVADHPAPLDPAATAARLDTMAYQVVASATSQGLDPEAVGHRVVAIARDGTTTPSQGA